MIEAGGGKAICNVIGAGVENKANAQLIAAAPELLRLAKLCERALPITKWKSLNIQLQAALAGVESREDRA
jgi:hypothetical protein